MERERGRQWHLESRIEGSRIFNSFSQELLIIAIFEKMLFTAIVPFQEIEIFSKQNFSKCLDLMNQTFFHRTFPFINLFNIFKGFTFFTYLIFYNFILSSLWFDYKHVINPILWSFYFGLKRLTKWFYAFFKNNISLALDFRTFLDNMKMSSLLSKILETGKALIFRRKPIPSLIFREHSL